MEIAKGEQPRVPFDEGVGRVLKGQLHIEAKGLARARPPVGCLHHAAAGPGHHLKTSGHRLGGQFDA